MSNMFSKDKLVFDPSAADDSDNIGAFVRASDGSLIGKQGIAEQNWLNVAAALHAGDGTPITQTAGALDVNLKSPVVVNVDMDGVYDGEANPIPDSVGLVAAERAASIDATKETLRLSAGAPSADAVDPANIHALDANSFLMGWNGTGWDRLKSTSGDLNAHITNATLAVTQSGTWTVQQGTPPWSVGGDVADDAADSGSPVKVGSRALSGPLSAVSSGDRADMISDLYRRVYVNNGSNIAIQNAAAAVDNTGAVQLAASALGGRRMIMVQNLSSKAIYLGKDNTVDNTNGLRLAAGGTLTLEIGENIGLWAKGESGSAQDIRLLEVA